MFDFKTIRITTLLAANYVRRRFDAFPGGSFFLVFVRA